MMPPQTRRSLRFRIALVGALLAGLPALAAAQASATIERFGISQSIPQSPLERQVRMRLDGAPLEDVLRDLAFQGYPIVYAADLARRGGRVRCDCDGVTLGEALNRMLDGTALTFTTTAGGEVVITRRPSRDVTLTLRGRVSDLDTGEPVPTATVEVAGTDLTALTNQEGSYRLPSVPSGTQTIRASRLGYRTVEKLVDLGDGGTAELDFELHNTPIQLDPLSVRVSTGTVVATEKKRVGNAVEVIGEPQIEMSGSQDLADLFQGRVTGVQATYGGGELGSGQEVRIRGVSSFRQGQEPLVYVDGVPVDIGVDPSAALSNRTTEVGVAPQLRLDEIGLGNVERIEVVKGPAAATLYGTEAVNGVIQIFTKDGQSGAPQGAVWTEQGTTSLRSNPLVDRAPRPDDIRGLFRTGREQAYGASLSGGAQGISYRLGMSYQDDEGVAVDNTQSFINATGSLRLEPAENLGIRLTGTMVNRENHHLLYKRLLHYASTGSDRFVQSGIESLDDLLDRGQRNEQSTDRFFGAGTLEYQPHEHVQTRISVGLDRSLQIEETVGLSVLSRGIEREHRETNFLRTSVNASTTLSYPKVGPITSSFSSGVQAWRDEVKYLALEALDLPNRDARALGLAAELRSLGTQRPEYSAVATVGAYVQEQLGIYDRLFLTFGLRADGNSSLGEDYGLAVYPKVSGSYVFEPFDGWETKLRAAWGRSGRAPNPYAAQRTFIVSRSFFSGEQGMRLHEPGNPALRPELGTERELGLDQGLWAGRLSWNATYFSQRTEDALIRVPLPSIYGFTAGPLANVGVLHSSGLEVGARLVPLIGPDHGLSVGFTYTRMFEDGRIIELGELTELTPNNQRFEFGTLTGLREGRSLTDLGVVTFLRLSEEAVAGEIAGVEFFGSRVPTHYGGVQLEGWRGPVRFSSNVAYGFGGHAFDSYLATQDERSGLLSSDTFIPRQLIGERYLFSTDYARLDAARATWELPSGWTFDRDPVEVWLEGRNLLSLDASDRADPTTLRVFSRPYTEAGATAGAADYTIPVPRSVRFGLRVRF